jgi:phosphoribosylglycinamide formyltransferase 1
MLSVIEACETGRLNATPALTIVSTPKALALLKAQEHNIPAFVIDKTAYNSEQEKNLVILELLKKFNVDIVLLVGYLSKIGPGILSEYSGRILNIHPSLLPRHGGKGMYGLHVHRAVINAKEKETGATIHLIEEEYDQGRILCQKKIDVLPSDTPESLAEKVLEIEHEILIATLQQIVSKEINIPALRKLQF